MTATGYGAGGAAGGVGGDGRLEAAGGVTMYAPSFVNPRESWYPTVEIPMTIAAHFGDNVPAHCATQPATEASTAAQNSVVRSPCFGCICSAPFTGG